MGNDVWRAGGGGRRSPERLRKQAEEGGKYLQTEDDNVEITDLVNKHLVATHRALAASSVKHHPP